MVPCVREGAGERREGGREGKMRSKEGKNELTEIAKGGSVVVKATRQLIFTSRRFQSLLSDVL